MISLSDAIRLESNNAAVNTFKPWWDVAVDYTLNGFLLVVLFAMAGTTLSGTPGLECLPENHNITSFNYPMSRYINAKCTTHVDGNILVIFPYIIFVQWLLLFVLHISWFNLPAVKSFLSSTFDSFNLLKQLDESRMRAKKKSAKRAGSSQQDQSNTADQEGLTDNDENDPSTETGRNLRLVYLVDWLQYLLQFKYHLVNLYAMKSLATVALTVVIAISITTWLVTFEWKASFTCDLGRDVPLPYDYNACSFAAAPYMYSMMVINVVFAVLLFAFNLRALLWLTNFRIAFSRYFTSWNNVHPLKEKPGFYDYFFCAMLFKSNSSEGQVVFKTMELAFKAFGDKTPEETEAASEFALAVPEVPSYHKDRFMSKEVLREFGMVHKRSAGSRDDLWVALANSIDMDAPAVVHTDISRVAREIRERVAQELREKHVLFKDLINKDDHCPVFEEYLEDIQNEEPRNNGIIEDHYVLMAFAIAYRLNVVVIRVQKSSLLYEPEHPEENQSVRFLTFVPPRYYYASSVDPNATNEQKDKGLVFLTDQVYQTDLLKKVTDVWTSKGYNEYKRTLEKILPQELPYQSKSVSKKLSKTELAKEQGLRQRFGRAKRRSEKTESFGLMETV